MLLETVPLVNKVIDPEIAMDVRVIHGKKALLSMGFDLSAANRTFGDGWLDAVYEDDWLIDEQEWEREL